MSFNSSQINWQTINRWLDANKLVTYTILVIVSLVVCIWNLGKPDLNNWDESLYGVNAYEMAERGDYLNPFYQGDPDQWNVKPPLSTNLIIVSQKLLGHNTLGLRTPSALAAFILVIVLFQFLKKEKDTLTAIIIASMLLGTTGLIGSHSGRTGDPDAIFTLFTTLGCLSFFRFTEHGKTIQLILTSIWFGLAFYTKSTAILLFFPGLFIYLIYSRQLTATLVQPRIWVAVFLFILFPISWIAASMIFGIEFEDSIYGGSSGWTNNLVYDTFQRFTGTGHFEQIEKSQDFIFTFLDACFNLWYIPFYGTLLMLIVMKIRKNTEFKSDCLLNLSLCLLIPFLITLQLSANVNGWYLVPIVPFVAIISVYGSKHPIEFISYYQLFSCWPYLRLAERFIVDLNPKENWQNSTNRLTL